MNGERPPERKRLVGLPYLSILSYSTLVCQIYRRFISDTYSARIDRHYGNNGDVNEHPASEALEGSTMAQPLTVS